MDTLESCVRSIGETDALNEAYTKLFDITDNFSIPVAQSIQTCELVCVYLCEKTGFSSDKASLNEEVLPPACREYLKALRGLKEVSYSKFIRAKKAFDCFSSWFLMSLSEEEKRSLRRTDYKVGGKKAAYDSLIEVSGYMDGKIRAASYLQAFSAVQKKNKEKELLSQILSSVKEINQKTDVISEKQDKLQASIDLLAKEVKELISGYQSFVEKQLSLSSSDEEKEHIMHTYVDECAEKIKEKNLTADEEEEEKLISSMGVGAWNKLDESSKSFLISAKVMYKSLVGAGERSDYSGICILVTKTLEVEIGKRFFKEFTSYMREHYPGRARLKLWPMGLLGRDGNPLSPEVFSMGNIAEILCIWHDPRCSEEQKENNTEKLLEFARAKVFTGKSDAEILELLHEYAEDINMIKEKFRNPSAHTGMIKKTNAEECFEIVLDTEKLLKRMLDSFDH